MEAFCETPRDGKETGSSIFKRQLDGVIHFILAGRGKAVIDDEEVALSEGDWVRIAPEGKRQFFASSDSPVTYICIQVKAGSLGAYTADDAL